VLDEFDLKILRRYQKNTRIPAEKIATEVGLSTAAVQRRLRRLRESGVIEAEVAKVAPKSVGLPVTCLVGIELERESASANERFKAKMAKHPQVQQCYYVTGPVDFMVIVLVPDMEAYDAFSRKVFLDDPNVRSFTTYVVLDRVKTDCTVPIGL
jgi:DNA-binding Lrp family transcriptional regulator